MRPTDSYLICATPRSGSTLLCDLLAGTGVAGRPEEYFQQLPATGRARHPRDYLCAVWDAELAGILGPSPVDAQPTQLEELGVATFGEYLHALLERTTTPNGVFGAKVMWGYLDGLLSGLRRAGLGDGAASAPELLSAAFPRLRYVHGTRRDTARQAVSLWRALQTWTWRHDGAADGRSGHEPVFHAGAIAALERSIEADDAAWERFFATHGLERASVVYEELAADPTGVLTATLEALELPVPTSVRELRPRLLRQADERSEDWLERYRAAGVSDSTSTSSTTSRLAAPGGSIG
jgi:trehalose 2-sulfotransferase